jgi:DUF4097 and DUF4098 domain-containing protein YvlB
MKKIIFALLLVSSAGFVRAQFNSLNDPFMTKTLSNESFQKINASTSHGNISVSPVAAAEARIEVYIHGNGIGIGDQRLSKEEIQSRLDEYYTLEVTVSNGELRAIARQKPNVFTTVNWKRSLSISFRIYSSQATATDLKTSHGNIDLAGMSGEQDLGTSHGNITVDKITGKLTGGTSHGDVFVKNVTEGVDVSTSHGNVHAESCGGTVKLNTSNGDVSLNKIKGKIHAGTSHGNIGGDTVEGELSAVTSHGDINLSNLNASVETSTSHGNISLQLQKGKGLDIDLHGKSIRLNQMENFSGSKESRSMKGTLNGGGSIVKAETSHGTVSLDFK